MKSLNHLKSFAISKENLKRINGGDICGAVNRCMQTAQRDGNTFLIPVCEEVLDPTHSCRQR
ncbi:hypothetical protein [uncultured Tenacibaculum sp.]|uniref:hypothetical protein n=1 Tax=uncultured Tenacibaculum sp. TaxID=174713 RepID=UPI0026166FB4|nr:hypothetical protein [uncultured Tenacibaculum sp.]